MRLRWALVGVVVFVGVVLLQNPWVFTPLENTTVYALDYFMPRSVGSSYTVDPGACSDPWGGMGMGGGSNNFEYDEYYSPYFNLSNLFLTHSNNKSYQALNENLLSRQVERRFYTFTPPHTGNYSLAWHRLDRTDLAWNLGLAYKVTIGNLSDSYLFMLPIGDTRSLLLPLWYPNETLLLKGGVTYNLTVDFKAGRDELGLFGVWGWNVCAFTAENHLSSSVLLIEKYAENMPPSVESVGGLNRTYHINSMAAGRVLDDLGVYGLVVRPSRHDQSAVSLSTSDVGNHSFNAVLGALVNGSEAVEICPTDAYGLTYCETHDAMIDDAPDAVVEAISAPVVEAGGNQTIIVQVFNNGTLPAQDYTLNITRYSRTLNICSEPVSLNIGERRNLTCTWTTRSLGGYHTLRANLKPSVMEYEGDNTGLHRTYIENPRIGIGQDFKILVTGLKVYDPSGTLLMSNTTDPNIDYFEIALNTSGFPYVRARLELNKSYVLEKSIVDVKLMYGNVSDDSWVEADNLSFISEIKKDLTAGYVDFNTTHFSPYTLKPTYAPPPPSTPPPPSSGGSSGGGGGGTLVYAVIGNSIDYPLAWPFLEDALNKTPWADGVRRFTPGNWTYQPGYCPGTYVACVLLGGHLALEGMGNHTAPLLDVQDRADLLARPSYTRLGNTWILAGATRRETALAAERWADEIIK